jgi:hypothetical protein
MSAACAFLGIVSFLDVISVIDIGMEVKDMAIVAVGAIMSLFLGRNISHIERDEKHRGGPGLRR